MFPPKRKGKPTKRPSKEKLSELYKEHTAKEIAAMYQVHVKTVENWIRTYRKSNLHGPNSIRTQNNSKD